MIDFRNWQKSRVENEKKLEGKAFQKVMISLEEASEILLSCAEKEIVKTKKWLEEIDLWHAGGRIAGSQVTALEPVPPFNRSVLDGYAVRVKDTLEASPSNPCRLKSAGKIPAGYTSEEALLPGTAVKIFTGAPIPKGSDAVIRVEELLEEEDCIVLKKPAAANEGIAPLGEEIKSGDKILEKGEYITSAHLSILASIGADSVSVLRKPRIGIMCTGDELAPLDEPLPPGKIRVSNLYTLAYLIHQAGGEPISLGIAKDDARDIVKVLKNSEKYDLDLILSTGGVSSGDYDVVKDAMHKSGFQGLFWKVAVRPGAPAAAAFKDGLLWLALSGNPSGAVIISLLLALPLTAYLSGKEWEYKKKKAVLQEPLFRKQGLRGYYWGKYVDTDDKAVVYPYIKQHCGSMMSYLKSNCLVVIPSGEVDWAQGKEVEILCL